MFFYVFIDPEIVRDANESGQDRLNLLARFLKDHLQDCLFAETDLWRVGSEIKEHIRRINFPHERKIITELMAEIGKKNSALVLEGDSYDEALFDFAIRIAGEYQLDLILSPRAYEVIHGQSWECSDLSLLVQTRFEERSYWLRPDIQIQPGTMTSAEFFPRYLGKIVRRSKRIFIIDYSIGQYFGGGHYFNVRKWIKWLDLTVEKPKLCEVQIVTYDGNGAHFTANALRQLLDEIRHEVDLQLTLEIKEFGKESLPHQRFLGIDSRWIDIGRGIDLFDRNDLCRDIRFAHAGRPTW